MDNPLISIIVPIYKVPENLLRHCIESCTNQTLKAIEIILVDDGSPDNCGKICDEYAAKDSRIKVIHKQNGGLVSARNAGYDVVSSEWQMYLDGDDWIADNCLSELVDFINKFDDIDVIFWKVAQDLNGKTITGKWEWPCQEDTHVYSNEECKELARNVLVYKSGIATAYAKLIKSEYAKKFDIKHDSRLRQGMEGVEFSLRVFYHAKKVLYVNRYYNFYRYNPNSLSKTVSEKNAAYITDCVKVIEEDIGKIPEKEAFIKALYQRVTYALIAVALSTYFHSANKDGLRIKIKKYSEYLNSIPFYKKAVYKTSTKGMGKQRAIVVWMLRLKLYFMLSFVASIKAYLLKKGKFDY